MMGLKGDLSRRGHQTPVSRHAPMNCLSISTFSLSLPHFLTLSLLFLTSSFVCLVFIFFFHPIQLSFFRFLPCAAIIKHIQYIPLLLSLSSTFTSISYSLYSYPLFSSLFHSPPSTPIPPPLSCQLAVSFSLAHFL